jgi:60 kDa SS-A/Ro ribonucleoprotein
MRYVWDHSHEYQREYKNFSALRFLYQPILHRIRQWDYLAAQRVDHFVANSHFVANRIAKYYERESEVLHPPVDLHRFHCRTEKDDHFLLVGRLIPYKHFDLALLACEELGLKVRVVRDAVRTWIGGISEYHAVKYGSVNSEGVTLRDILRLTHPKPSSDVLSERFGWLAGSRKGNLTLNPQILSLEKLKRATTEEEIVQLVRQGRLPYEVVVPSVPKMTKAVWAELLRQAPYMNLLRNLRSFREHGVFEDQANVEYVVGRLTDPRAVEASRVLPFRFFDALKAFTFTSACDMQIRDAIASGLELSFVNLPNFGSETHVTIGSDVSGSMGDAVSENGSTRYIDICGLFTGALLKRTEKVLALPFQSQVIEREFSKHDGVVTTAAKISSLMGGGTAVGAPIQYLLNRKIKTDVFIGITDNEEWAYGSGHNVSGKFYDLWLRYKKEVNPNAQAFLITIAPYRDAVAPMVEGVHFIYGWSDKVLNYIDLKLKTGANQVDKIRTIEV